MAANTLFASLSAAPRPPSSPLQTPRVVMHLVDAAAAGLCYISKIREQRKICLILSRKLHKGLAKSQPHSWKRLEDVAFNRKLQPLLKTQTSRRDKEPGPIVGLWSGFLLLTFLHFSVTLPSLVSLFPFFSWGPGSCRLSSLWAVNLSLSGLRNLHTFCMFDSLLL